MAHGQATSLRADPSAYLDRNAVAHLYDSHPVTGADERTLRGAIAWDRLSIVLSPSTIEETLAPDAVTNSSSSLSGG
jgi:hypothetical protein